VEKDELSQQVFLTLYNLLLEGEKDMQCVSKVCTSTSLHIAPNRLRKVAITVVICIVRLRKTWQSPRHTHIALVYCASYVRTRYWSVPGFKILPKAVGESPEIIRLHIRHLNASSAKTLPLKRLAGLLFDNFTDHAVLAARPWEAEMQLAALLGKSGADTFLARSRA